MRQYKKSSAPTHFLHVLDQETKEECLITVVQIREEAALAERVLLLRERVVQLSQLRFHRQPTRRHQTT